LHLAHDLEINMLILNLQLGMCDIDENDISIFSGISFNQFV